jgi:hypothetical protein
MHQTVNWQAYSSNNRNKAIDAVKGVIFSSGGYIVNFNMFSDLAISISIEIEEKDIEDLHKAFSGILNISDIDLDKINVKSNKEWLVLLNISFNKGKGELKRNIPAVPG